jgi:hypothetical protein
MNTSEHKSVWDSSSMIFLPIFFNSNSGLTVVNPVHTINPLTPKDLLRRRAVSPLKIKIHSKNMREKPTNTPIILSVC